MMLRLSATLHCALSLLCLLGPTATRAETPISFNRDIRPILSDNCFRCHGPDQARREADLRLDDRAAATAKRAEGLTAIVPGKPEASAIIQRITSAHADERMPPADSGSALTPTQIALLRRWIAQGAEYQPHWAFVPVARPSLPPLQAPTARNAIDYFVQARLQAEGLQLSPTASRETLLRRVSLTLTGLPPTLAELDACLADDAPNAYERNVDRLLASPRLGERFAVDWLDAARFADTNGYYTDNERQAWPWRDWVINAYNAKLPFDQFTIEQLAGDQLPQPTTAQMIATGFNRNHMVTNETGIIEEEYRIGYVADRVDTTTAVWLGLTFGCARCHDHKYDPISQKEYYQVFAAFNNIQESGLIKDVAPLSPAPNLSLPTPEQDTRLADLAQRRREGESCLKSHRPALDQALAEWEPTVLASLALAPTAGSLVHFDFDRDDRNHGPREVESSTTGALAYEAGVSGKGIKFDATQYIEFSDPTPLERDRPFTLSVWLMPSSAPQGCVASKMDSNVESRGFEILWYKSQPRINLAHHYGRNGIEVVAQQKFSGRQWRQLVVTYDGSSRAAGLKVYVDGKLNPVDVRRDNLSGSVTSVEPWRIAWKGTGIGFDGGLDEFRLFDRELAADEVDALFWREFLEGTIGTPNKERSRPQSDKLESYYLARHGTPEVRQLIDELARLRAEEDATKKEILSVSVMQEMDKPRATHVLTRGQYDQPAGEVPFGAPAALGPLPTGDEPHRLRFAKWLVQPTQPLTARVAVNRLWQQCFGEGLVRTVNDFGLQGELPTHLELLDFLADRLVTTGWDQAAILRLIVTSATFQQSSHFTPPLLAKDPDNRLLGRGPRHRLAAEVLRDQALFVSGLLVERIGGPSVKPHQPPGIWEAVSYNGDTAYEPDPGESLYRRGLYTYIKRQAPPPGMLLFDGPTREVCSVRRPRTNTPLQALALLNDQVFVEAARNLASRMLRGMIPSGNSVDGLAVGFRMLTGRPPMPAELAALERDLDQHRNDLRDRPAAVTALLQVGESPIDTHWSPNELAAWTMTASVLLNLDEAVTQH